MHTTELEKLAALPLVQDAIRAQAQAIEGEALQARLACLDAYKQAGDELAILNTRTAELDTMQAELDRQRDELARQRAAHEIEVQHARARQSAQARELHRHHGGALVATIDAQLDSHASSLIREAERLRSLRESHQHWTGEIIEKPSPAAMAKADELERQTSTIEKARAAVLALQYASLSPQAIERAIRAELNGAGYNLATKDAEPEGWQIEGWERGKKRAA